MTAFRYQSILTINMFDTQTQETSWFVRVFTIYSIIEIVSQSSVWSLIQKVNMHAPTPLYPVPLMFASFWALNKFYGYEHPIRTFLQRVISFHRTRCSGWWELILQKAMTRISVFYQSLYWLQSYLSAVKPIPTSNIKPVTQKPLT